MSWFGAGLAVGGHWGLAAKSCLQQIGPLHEEANLGFLYVTEAFADSLSSILTYLRETTGIDYWLGGVGYGVFGPETEIHHGAALALMIGRVTPDGLRLFDRFDPEQMDDFRAEHASWLSRQTVVTGLVHGNPRTLHLPEAVTRLASVGEIFLAGGLTAATGGPGQICGRVGDARLSGLLLGDAVPIAIGLTQGCSPIGKEHRITEAVDNVLMELDGISALETLKREAGTAIARDLSRAAGYIHVARPIEGCDRRHYVVRSLLAIDPDHGWLAVGEGLSTGDRLFFVRRDPDSAQRDLRQMLSDIAARLRGQTIQGGLYISCVERRNHLFDDDTSEGTLIRQALGSFPLVGFSASGEICHDRLYAFTGVLILFL
jgi:small ligand-binding sensory domain FIST